MDIDIISIDRRIRLATKEAIGKEEREKSYKKGFDQPARTNFEENNKVNPPVVGAAGPNGSGE